MPCRISNDVHERTNALATVPTAYSVNLQDGERAVTSRWGEKTLWSFTAACSCHIFWNAERSQERRCHPLGGGGALV